MWACVSACACVGGRVCCGNNCWEPTVTTEPCEILSWRKTGEKQCSGVFLMAHMPLAQRAWWKGLSGLGTRSACGPGLRFLGWGLTFLEDPSGPRPSEAGPQGLNAQTGHPCFPRGSHPGEAQLHPEPRGPWHRPTRPGLRRSSASLWSHGDKCSHWTVALVVF